MLHSPHRVNAHRRKVLDPIFDGIIDGPTVVVRDAFLKRFLLPLLTNPVKSPKIKGCPAHGAVGFRRSSKPLLHARFTNIVTTSKGVASAVIRVAHGALHGECER